MDVLRHPVDILHHLYGLFEHIGVHLLDNIGLLLAVAAQESHLVGVVDVANLDFLIYRLVEME